MNSLVSSITQKMKKREENQWSQWWKAVLVLHKPFKTTTKLYITRSDTIPSHHYHTYHQITLFWVKHYHFSSYSQWKLNPCVEVFILIWSDFEPYYYGQKESQLKPSLWEYILYTGKTDKQSVVGEWYFSWKYLIYSNTYKME